MIRNSGLSDILHSKLTGGLLFVPKAASRHMPGGFFISCTIHAKHIQDRLAKPPRKNASKVPRTGFPSGKLDAKQTERARNVIPPAKGRQIENLP